MGRFRVTVGWDVKKKASNHINMMLVKQSDR